MKRSDILQLEGHAPLKPVEVAVGEEVVADVEAAVAV